MTKNENEALKYGAKLIEDARLEPIPFKFQDPKTLIYMTAPEGTSLCPRSGFPDFWALHLWMVPQNFIVELKSLKLYLNRFRNRGIYHEELPHTILSDLRKAIEPAYVKIVLDYGRRGNIQTDVQLEYSVNQYSGIKAPEWAIRYGLK